MNPQRYLCLADFEPAAQRRLPHCIFKYIQGGVEDNVARTANRAVFEAIAMRTRSLVDTSERDCSVTTLGRTWAAPFGIAPMGGIGLSVFQGDLVMARAAARANIPFILSGSSLIRLERVIEANPETWFQVYLSPRAEENERLLRRAVDAGFRNLVVTVDVPVPGNREDDVRNGFTSPLRPTPRLLLDGLMHPRWLTGALARTLLVEGMPHFENFAINRVPMIAFRGTRPHRRDNLGWDDLQRVRDLWPHRLVLKGILDAGDVGLARAAGVDAIQVSNHGGRQFDAAVAPLRVLPEIKAAAGAMPVFFDSGIRRGSDVLKTMALGAGHVFLGRPFMYAAAVGGESGVQRAIELLKGEILRNLALLGVPHPSPETLAPLLVD